MANKTAPVNLDHRFTAKTARVCRGKPGPARRSATAGGNRAQSGRAMAQLFPHPHHSPDRWLRRLDRAASAMNPFLTVLAIGLLILNLTCLASLASRLPIAHRTAKACQIAS